MAGDLGFLGNLAYDAHCVWPFKIDLTDPSVAIVRECLRDFDVDLSVDEDPVLYLLLLGHDEDKVAALYHDNPERLRELALQEAVREKASDIVAEIRRSQLNKVLFLLQRQYPMLANRYRQPEKIDVDQLPPDLKLMVLGSAFTHEQFVRAYIGDTATPNVYDLASQWQLWAAENGLHPALITKGQSPPTSAKPLQSKSRDIVESQLKRKGKSPYTTAKAGTKPANPLRKAFISILLSRKPETRKIAIHAAAYDFCKEHQQQLPTVDMVYNDLIYLQKHPDQTAEALLKLSKDKRLYPNSCDNSFTIEGITTWLDNSDLI